MVILDELGYLGLRPGGPLLFQFCADRYERGSILITTNLEFSRWGEVFSDTTFARGAAGSADPSRTRDRL
jgi:DNA replication protein DnaC